MSSHAAIAPVDRLPRPFCVGTCTRQYWFWVGLPGANWDLVHRVSEDCTSVSAAAVERRSSPNAIIILALGSLDEYDPEVFLPTPGPLASASVSNLCPQGPHYPGQAPGSR